MKFQSKPHFTQAFMLDNDGYISTVFEVNTDPESTLFGEVFEVTSWVDKQPKRVGHKTGVVLTDPGLTLQFPENAHQWRPEEKSVIFMCHVVSQLLPYIDVSDRKILEMAEYVANRLSKTDILMSVEYPTGHVNYEVQS